MTVEQVTEQASEQFHARAEILRPYIAIIDRDRGLRSPESLAYRFAQHTDSDIAHPDGVRWVINQLTR